MTDNSLKREFPNCKSFRFQLFKGFSKEEENLERGKEKK